MMNNNKKAINKLTLSTLKNKTKTLFMFVSIILVTFMIYSIFSIGFSYYDNYQTYNLRSAGTTSQIMMTNLTKKQKNKLNDLDYIKNIGNQHYYGRINFENSYSDSQIVLSNYDDIEWKEDILPTVASFEGNYPTKKNEIAYVAEGSNMDDLGDYRPGLQAVAELGVKSPLREAKLTKAEIRLLSKEMGLPTWDKPSFACLASRFVYGETISKEKLVMVENAEQLLLEHGFRQFRVRMHGMMARIEVLPEEFSKLLQEEIREDIVKQFKQFGFTYVTMDLTGYRMGSMNETLGKKN